MKFFIFLFLLISFNPICVLSQELNFEVEMNKDRINRTGIDHIDNIPQQFEKYLNDYKWTEKEFLEQERLTGTIQINLNDINDNFTINASIVIQLQRPIYGTQQNTPTLILLDNAWSFSYPPSRQLIHDEFQFDDIASLLDFYAYIILAYDADTFSSLGGTAFYNKANAVHDLAQTSSSLGWTRATRQGRASLIQNITNPNFEKYRQALYQYHRLGLDQFIEKPKEARNNILGALALLEENRKAITDIFLFDTFFNTKYRELTSVFIDAEETMKQEAYTILVRIDQSHITKYDELMN